MKSKSKIADFVSMVALQGDADKLFEEAEQIALRLKEKAKEEIAEEREEIVTNGYFGEESTGELKMDRNV